MLIQPPCVVSMLWRLEDTQGVLIDESDEAHEFFVGGDDLLASVEQALLDQQAGFSTRLQIEPAEAFGEYDADLVFFESRSLFPEGVEPGMHFDGPPEGATTPGMPADAIYIATEVYDTHVVLDGNHPLAGIALRLALTVTGVREASSDEIAARSVGVAAVSLLHSGAARMHLH